MNEFLCWFDYILILLCVLVCASLCSIIVFKL